MEKPYLNLRQAAEYLLCDVKTLRKWVVAGLVPYKDFTKPGSIKTTYRFTKEDLDKAREVL
jgi:excisionase family DNA binding protein